MTSGTHDPAVRLLKLHGSLNWFVRTRDKNPSISALFPGQRKTIYTHMDGQISVGSVQRTSRADRGDGTSGTCGRWFFLQSTINTG